MLRLGYSDTDISTRVLHNTVTRETISVTVCRQPDNSKGAVTLRPACSRLQFLFILFNNINMWEEADRDKPTVDGCSSKQIYDRFLAYCSILMLIRVSCTPSMGSMSGLAQSRSQINPRPFIVFIIMFRYYELCALLRAGILTNVYKQYILVLLYTYFLFQYFLLKRSLEKSDIANYYG